MKRGNRRGFILAAVFLIASVSAIYMVSCGGGGGGGADNTVDGSDNTADGSDNTADIPSKMLYWDPPTQFADGGTLVPSEDLSYYELYINETGTFLDADTPKAVFPSSNPSSGDLVTMYDLATITPSLEIGKTYYLALRTVEKNGGKSGFTPAPLRIVYGTP